jgi:hypothetical protein
MSRQDSGIDVLSLREPYAFDCGEFIESDLEFEYEGLTEPEESYDPGLYYR